MLKGILLNGLIFLSLSCSAANTNGNKSLDENYAPSNSHFWCGEHCSVQAGCEEGLICVCHQINASGQELLSKEEAMVKIAESVRQARGTIITPSTLSDEAIFHQPHEIRLVHGAFNDERWLCGVFYRFRY